MEINCSQKLGIIQAVLHTLNANLQNKKVSTTIHVNKSVVSSIMSIS